MNQRPNLKLQFYRFPIPPAPREFRCFACGMRAYTDDPLYCDGVEITCICEDCELKPRAFLICKSCFHAETATAATIFAQLEVTDLGIIVVEEDVKCKLK